MIEWDLIENLYRRGLEHILDQIFGYLDYYCLRRAELVSVVWQEALLEGKIWKTLLGRNMFLFPCWKDMFVALKGMKHKSLDFQDDSPEYYRKVCCLIEVELQVLESNWKKMKYSERKSEFGPLCTSTHEDSDYFDLNGDWIVRVHQNDRRIVIRNRWTLGIEDILEIPIMQIQFNGDVPIVKSVKINDSFIVVSFCRHPEICVWNTKTRDLIYVIDAGSLGIQEEDGNYEDLKIHPECGLSLWKNLLLSCYHRSLDSNWIDMIVTLRCLSPCMGEEVALLHKAVIKAGPGYFCGLFVDEIYTVLFFIQSVSGTMELIIEIRNTTSFEIKTNIKFNLKNIPCDFHYSNGLVVTHGTKSIRIWDVL